MFPRMKTFIRDEDGAVTVDWVVLTAAVVVLPMLIFTTGLSDAIAALASDISDTILEASPEGVAASEDSAS